MDFAMSAFADISNVGMHFMHPFTQFSHNCSCLLCVANEEDITKPLQESGIGLRPLATPSDLDLITTGSKAIRQLIVLSATSQVTELRGFCTELKTHLNYNISYTLPTVDEGVPYQVLVFVLCTRQEKHVYDWFHKVLARHTKRAVVICPTADAEFFVILRSPKITLLAYSDLNRVLVGLSHGMMSMRQRLMAKDVSKFIESSALNLLQTQQQGMCLFL